MADVLSRGTESFLDKRKANSQSILAIELSPGSQNDLFRPSLADAQKIGFFSLDRTTQTDSTDIVEVKDLSQNVGQLLEDAVTMRRDINFAQSVMQADFETKLQQKAIELYVRVNDKISDIEKMHEERVATVRRAFKQQLADAIARMHTLYHRDFAKKMDLEKSKKELGAVKWEKKAKELQATVAHNEAIISMLKQQIQDLQDKPQQVVTFKTPSPDYAKEEEISELREKVFQLGEKISGLNDDNIIKDETIAELNSEIDGLNEQLEKERIMVEQQKTKIINLRKEMKQKTDQLNFEKDEVANQLENDRAANRRMNNQLENNKLSLEKENEGRIRRAQEKAMAEARKEMEAMQEAHNEKLKQLAEEKKMVEQLLAKEKSKTNVRSQENMDLEYAKRNEQKMQTEIAKLKKEIDRVHRAWEKKFAILQQSLHALKDESFLRQTMQRQAAQLHQAAISYAYDAPMGIAPTKPPRSVPPATKKPLPNINMKGHRGKSPMDYMSYTVSAPSGRATTVFSVDENQVMSGDEQDFPPDVRPLPSPPPRNPPAEEMEYTDSRPSTVKSKSSHIVILPSAEEFH